MNGSAKQDLAAEGIRQCISALAALVDALHKLIGDYPELRDKLLAVTEELGNALPGFATITALDYSGLEKRLSAVEAKLLLVVHEIASLKAGVAALKADVAALKADVAQLKLDMVEVRAMLREAWDIFLTKEEFHKEMNKLTWRIYSWMAGLVAATYFIARYVH